MTHVKHQHRGATPGAGISCDKLVTVISVGPRERDVLHTVYLTCTTSRMQHSTRRRSVCGVGNKERMCCEILYVRCEKDTASEFDAEFFA